MDNLKPCPFCGSAEYVESGFVRSPDAWWDSGMGGEEYAYVICYECGIILKANNLEDAVTTWNRRTSNETI